MIARRRPTGQQVAWDGTRRENVLLALAAGGPSVAQEPSLKPAD
jgi:hypothetical protein